MEDVNNRQLGSTKEEQACKYLLSLGYRIVERNWHWGKRGEIDIIAIDPQRYGKEFLVFVEVKYRSWSMDMSLHALGYKKIEQIKKLATIYMQRRGYHHNKTSVSFDFIAISEGDLRHIKDIVR